MDNVKTAIKLIKRNAVSVIFPTIAVLSIYADLRRTASWKRQLAEQEKQEII